MMILKVSKSVKEILEQLEAGPPGVKNPTPADELLAECWPMIDTSFAYRQAMHQRLPAAITAIVAGWTRQQLADRWTYATPHTRTRTATALVYGHTWPAEWGPAPPDNDSSHPSEITP